jgi:hypothetical protein
VILILVTTGVISVGMVVGVVALFASVLIPVAQYGGKSEIPSDLPVYPGAHLTSARANTADDCTTVGATWSTPAAAANVTEFYRLGLNSGAWTATDSGPSRYGFEVYFDSTSGPHREGVMTVRRYEKAASTTISVELYESGPRADSSCSLPAK